MKASNCQWFSIAVDESAGVSNTVQLDVFFPGIDMDFDINEK
jgi:hypothetical protein